MTQAINSSKGKAIEALFSHALRACRLSDLGGKGHAAAWAEMKPVFDQEIGRCKEGNYEFSTLTANYIANLDYIDRSWLQTNIGSIFPREFLANFHCALEGLAYAQATRQVYSLLLDGGVLDFALRQESKGRHAREKLVERIALAFLWATRNLTARVFPIFLTPVISTTLSKLPDSSGVSAIRNCRSSKKSEFSRSGTDA
jgi:hypothetical protein